MAKAKIEASRESRIDDARRLAEREAELSDIPNMEYNSPLSLIKDMIPEGWEYAFKRTHVGDREDVSNWMAAQQEGWEVVPYDRHPNLFNSKGVKGMESYQGGFFYKGTILCERPKSINSKRKNHIAKTIYDEIINLNANAPKMGTEHLRAGQFMEETRWSNSPLPYEAEWGKTVGNL